MRKLIVLQFMSLDGVVQAPGGPEEDPSNDFKYGGWSFPFFDEEAGNEMAKQMKTPFDLLLGRKTYDIFAGYWPTHSDNWPGVNEATKYVATRNGVDASWENSVVLGGDVAAEVKKLKSEDGPDIQVHGSSDLIQTLLKNDLVDELWLKTFPIILGKGKKLFTEGATPAAFELTESTITDKGVIFASYARAGDIQTGSF